MAVPTVINGDFEVPVLAEGGWTTPSGAGWTFGGGTGVGRLASVGPGQHGWLNNNSIRQSITFDGSPCMLKLLYRRSLTSGTTPGMRVILGGVEIFGRPFGEITAIWTEAAIPLTPAAGALVLEIESVGSQLLVDDVRFEAAIATPGRLLCFGPGSTGLIG